MASHASVTTWLHLLKAGNQGAAQKLWERYFHRLVVRARRVLGAAPRRAADEDDVALSAFASFCRGVEQGRFPRLDDRHDLWRLLLLLTARKAAHQIRDEHRASGGGKVIVEADMWKPGLEAEDVLLNHVIGSEPTPELVVQMTEEYRCLLDKLGNAELRSIAVWQMEGYTVDEIAAKLGRSPRTIARKLTIIRDRWRDEDQA